MRLLFVTQRYGAQVIGGAETHARRLAERLAARHRVEVATTTALDYWTWANHYPAGCAEVNGVPVRRFPVRKRRARDFKTFEDRVATREHSLADEHHFLERQGPVVPQLLDFLHREGYGYDAVFFYTYLYYPTVYGLPQVPQRAILIPTAHDEWALRLAPCRALFHIPRAIGYLTPEERDLVHTSFRNEHVPSEVIGVGLDPPPAHSPGAFRATRGLVGHVVLYLGQVVEAKGCDELFAHWAAYRDRDGAPDATLVLAGPVRMRLPDRADIVALGEVSETEKYAALAAAHALVNPSRFESLGIALLEAWQVGTPVLVPSQNAVTAGQVGRSGGGTTYGSTAEFIAALDGLLADRERGEAGRAWVERECSWEAVEERVERLTATAAAGA